MDVIFSCEVKERQKGEKQSSLSVENMPTFHDSWHPNQTGMTSHQGKKKKSSPHPSWRLYSARAQHAANFFVDMLPCLFQTGKEIIWKCWPRQFKWLNDSWAGLPDRFSHVYRIFLIEELILFIYGFLICSTFFTFLCNPYTFEESYNKRFYLHSFSPLILQDYIG